ncbi:uncharacterized protein LOC121837987 [Ixodes scapularis]|uniref:uncharacterized protein LOC121837987 n=1 Tax=Ixodes scapularis TaxID=6945 RepID=UPI001C38ECE4|nr:uncharacterized protein LOC121837987 [Ixodes scapularis]
MLDEDHFPGTELPQAPSRKSAPRGTFLRQDLLIEGPPSPLLPYNPLLVTLGLVFLLVLPLVVSATVYLTITNPLTNPETEEPDADQVLPLYIHKAMKGAPNTLSELGQMALPDHWQEKSSLLPDEGLSTADPTWYSRAENATRNIPRSRNGKHSTSSRMDPSVGEEYDAEHRVDRRLHNDPKKTVDRTTSWMRLFTSNERSTDETFPELFKFTRVARTRTP